MATQGDEEEDDMQLGSWSVVESQRGRWSGVNRRDEGLIRNKTTIRSLEENSSDEGGSAVCKKIVREASKVILTFRREDEHLQVSSIALSRELKKKIGEVEMAQVLRDGNLLVICKTDEQKEKALQVESIWKKMVSERRVLGERRVVRGVITGIPVDEDLERLKRSISGAEVSRVKRLQRTVNGERLDSLSVLLEVQGNALPERVRVGCMSFPVRAYVPPPLCCYKCQRYGHIAEACKGRQRCPNCGGEHRYEECEEREQLKCCNCGGQHRVTFGGCEVRKTAVEVEHVKAVNNLSYAEAVRRVQGQRGREKQETSYQEHSRIRQWKLLQD